MAVEELVYAIPQELVGKFSWVLIILQAVGWAIIVYIIFSIINTMISRKRNKAIEQINYNLLEIKELLKKSLSSQVPKQNYFVKK